MTQLEDIRELLSRLLPGSSPKAQVATAPDFSEQNVWVRIGLAVSEVGFASEPAIVLAALPDCRIDFPTLFESQRSELVGLLEDPPAIRRAGFDLATYQKSQIVKGQRRQAVAENYMGLFIWRDGLIVHVARADGEHLCWPGKWPLIHPLVLVESTYLFAELCKRAFDLSQPKPQAAEYSLQLCNVQVDGQLIKLYPGVATAQTFRAHPPKSAPDATTTARTNRLSLSAGPGEAAFGLLSRLYEQFGFDHEEIPYVSEVDGNRTIDPQQILQIHGD